MKLTAQEKEQARVKGVSGATTKCDACNKVLGYLRYTIKDDNREFCTAAERDKCFYSPAELEKAYASAACIHCRGSKDGVNSPYCTNCRTTADPLSILTRREGRQSKPKKGKKDADNAPTRKAETGNPMRINRRRKHTNTPNPPKRTVDTSPSA